MSNVLTVDPADLPTGQEIELALVPGNAFQRLRCTSGTTSGGVSSVTGTSPIVITGPPGTPNVTLDAAATDFWPFDAEIRASAVLPELAQAQAAAGGGQVMTARTQAAATGSNAKGGDFSTVLGASDGTAVGAGQPFSWIGQEITPGVPVVVIPPSNYYNYFIFKGHGGGVVNLVVGGGTNNIGAGIAGAEISAFAQLSIATEIGGTNPADVLIQPASAFAGGQAFFRHLTDPTLGTPGLSFGGSGDDSFQALTGILRVAFMLGASHQPILVQRDQSNTIDLNIIAREFNVLEFGNFNEDHKQFASQNISVQILHGGGIGWNIFGPAGFAIAVGTDAAKTISYGSVASASGSGGQRQLYNTVTNTTAPGENITQGVPGPGITPTVANSITRFQYRVTGLDTVTHEWTTFEITQSFSFFAGVVTASINAATTDNIRESNAGLAAGLVAAFVIVSNTIELQVTPFSANAIQWIVEVVTVVNAGSGI